MQPSKFLAFDTETTGLPEWKKPSGDDCQPHLVQIAAKLVQEDGTIVDTYNAIIRPDGWDIPKETVDIHGIDQVRAIHEGLPEPEVLRSILDMAAQADYRMAYNHTFDARIVRIATKRYCAGNIQDDWHAMPFKDPMLIAKPIMRLPPRRKYGYRNPSLSACYEYFCNEPFPEAHTAEGDVDAMLRIYFAMKAGKFAGVDEIRERRLSNV